MEVMHADIAIFTETKITDTNIYPCSYMGFPLHQYIKAASLWPGKTGTSLASKALLLMALIFFFQLVPSGYRWLIVTISYLSPNSLATDCCNNSPHSKLGSCWVGSGELTNLIQLAQPFN
jgi:hypothetical protein